MRSRMTDVDVAVIGAGCGGLSAAALLAGQGRRVLVLDQNDAVGGCASSFERDGYTFDVAASIFEVLSRCSGHSRCLAPVSNKRLTSSVVIPLAPLPCGMESESHFQWEASSMHCANCQKRMLGIGVVTPPTARSYTTHCSTRCTFSRSARSASSLEFLRKRPALLRYLPTFLTSYQPETSAIGRRTHWPKGPCWTTSPKSQNRLPIDGEA